MRRLGYAILQVENFVYIVDRKTFSFCTDTGCRQGQKIRPVMVGLQAVNGLYILNKWERTPGFHVSARSPDSKGYVVLPPRNEMGVQKPVPELTGPLGLLGGVKSKKTSVSLSRCIQELYDRPTTILESKEAEELYVEHGRIPRDVEEIPLPAS